MESDAFTPIYGVCVFASTGIELDIFQEKEKISLTSIHEERRMGVVELGKDCGEGSRLSIY
jgi:hypothetical protein